MKFCEKSHVGQVLSGIGEYRAVTGILRIFDVAFISRC